MRVNCGASQTVNMAEFHVDYTTCVKQGRYVTFYNERVDRVHYPVDYRINAVYTELCEVIVSGNNLYPSLKKREKTFKNI